MTLQFGRESLTGFIQLPESGVLLVQGFVEVVDPSDGGLHDAVDLLHLLWSFCPPGVANFDFILIQPVGGIHDIAITLELEHFIMGPVVDRSNPATLVEKFIHEVVCLAKRVSKDAEFAKSACLCERDQVGVVSDQVVTHVQLVETFTAPQEVQINETVVGEVEFPQEGREQRESTDLVE